MIIDFKFNGQSFNNPTDALHIRFQDDIRKRIEKALEIVKDKVDNTPAGSITIEYSHLERYDNMRVNGFGMGTANVLMALDGF